MDSAKYNLVVIGFSCFEGMAPSKRLRNLFDPLIKKNLINVNNLIFKEEIVEPIAEYGEIDSINYRVIGYKITNILTVLNFFFIGLHFLKKNKRPNYINIIYNYNGPDIQNIIFLLFGRFIGYKIICDIVEDQRYNRKVSFLNSIRITSSILLLRHSRYFANSLIGISEHLRYRLKAISKNKIPVFLIPISVNLENFENSNHIKANSNLKIFYGGSFTEKDGIEHLIDAFDEVAKKHNNIELVITGRGIKSDLDRLNYLINKAVYKDKILFRGFLNATDYYSLLNECDIFCMIRVDSKYANAGFPFKLGEYLASGKAIIATNVGDVPKYLINNVNAIVILPSSVKGLADSLSFLIENPDKMRSIGIEGRKTAETFFDSEKVSMKLYSILQLI
jgi:glycosyltransferase involved in cell wall biosynthesis